MNSPHLQITDLPFNKKIGLQRSSDPMKNLMLPSDRSYTNHLGTVHASALLALAEATSGDYLIQELWGIGFEVIPVVRRVEAKFKKPAMGSIYSRQTVHEEARQQFMEGLFSKGRALLEINVDVFDEQETHALTATFEWFVVKK